MKIFLISALLTCAAILCAPALLCVEPAGNDRSYIEGTEVIINEERITYSEIDREVRKMTIAMQGQDFDEEELIQTIVHGLIRERLLAQLAEREQIQIDERKLDQLIEKKAEELGGESELIKAVFPLRMLTSGGMTIDDVRNSMKKQEKIRAVLQKKTAVYSIFVTPKQIKDYYKAHKDEWKLPAAIKYREIRIDYVPPGSDYKPANFREFKDREAAGKYAENILERIGGGGDFVKIATEESNSPWCAEGGLHKTADGGEFIRKESLLKFKTDFLFAQDRKNGDISGVIEGGEKENGAVAYYILKVEELKQERTISFEESQELIKVRIVADEQNRRREELLKKLYEEAYIYPEEFRKPWTEFSSQ